MPKVHVLQTNFTAGEFSPKLMGRVDIAKYPNAAKQMRNALPLVHGGVVRRFGTRFMGEVHDSSKKTKLISYSTSQDDAFTLELSEDSASAGIIRAWKDDAIVNAPIVWLTQGFTGYPGYVGNLPAATTNGYLYSGTTTTPGPWAVGYRPTSVRIGVSAGEVKSVTLYVVDHGISTVGTSTFNTINGILYVDIALTWGSDDLRYIQFAKGVSTGSMNIVSVEFTGGQLPAQAVATPWGTGMLDRIRHIQDGANMTVVLNEVEPTLVGVNPSNFAIYARAMSLSPPWFEEGGETYTNITIASKGVGTGVTMTAVSASFINADVGRYIWEADGTGIAKVTAFTSTTQVTVEITQEFSSNLVNRIIKQDSPKATCTPSAVGPIGATITLTLGTAGWTSKAVGSYVVINGGLAEITAYTSSTVVSARVLQVLDNTTAAQSGAWTQEFPIWYYHPSETPAKVYPGAIAKHEQRLVFANTVYDKQGVWGSEAGVSVGFTKGAEDDAAYAFSIASEVINPIEHLVSLATSLVALSFSGEFSIKGGVEKPITPTNVQVRQQSTNGCSSVRPIRIGDEVVFSQRAGRKVLSLGYKIERDSFVSNDITLLAEHITYGGVVDMAYAQEPYSLLACVLGNGLVAIMSYDAAQDVQAWSLHDFGGIVESICSVPAGEEDHLVMVVKRTIDGADVRYVERMDYARKLDCSVTGTAGSPTTSWSGFDHLEGETVDVIADGVYVGQKTVSSGGITLDTAASAIEVGLPYTATVQLLPIELQFNNTAQGRKVRTGKAYIKFLESIGGQVDGKPIETAAWTTAFTGDKEINLLGWDLNGGDITLEQPEPQPWHVLCVTREVTIND